MKHRDLTKECAHAWERAAKEHHHSEAAVQTAKLTHTAMFTIASVPVTDNQLVRVPSSGGNMVPTNLGAKSIELLINLSTAVKEASGNTLALSVFNAADNSFIAGINWASYGAQITVTDPDGTVHVDPDPTLRIPYTTISGVSIYLTYLVVGVATAGVTVNRLS